MLILIQCFDNMLHVHLLLWIRLVVGKVNVDIFNIGGFHFVCSDTINQRMCYLSNFRFDFLFGLFFFSRIHNLKIIGWEFGSEDIHFSFRIKDCWWSWYKWLRIESKFSFLNRIFILREQWRHLLLRLLLWLKIFRHLYQFKYTAIQL